MWPFKWNRFSSSFTLLFFFLAYTTWNLEILNAATFGVKACYRNYFIVQNKSIDRVNGFSCMLHKRLYSSTMWLLQVQMMVSYFKSLFCFFHWVAMKQKCHHNCEGGLVGVDRGLSSQRIFPSHAQNFLEFWKSPADLAIIPQVNLKKQKQNTYKYK